jgi:amino-acid N-acetyltransferase
MLPRSLHEIYEHIRDYFVCQAEGRIIGVCALHPVWEDIAEIRSIAVAKKHQGQGIGKRLVRKSLREAASLGMKKVFALTYKPGYFKRLGFEEIDKNELPHKIWVDCLKCSKFPDCPEVAVIYYL